MALARHYRASALSNAGRVYYFLCFAIQKRKQIQPSRGWPVIIFFGFFICLVFHFVVLASDQEEQWKELTGDWIRSLSASVIGLALGLILTDLDAQSRQGRSSVEGALIILGMGGTVVIFGLRYALEGFQTGKWIHSDFYMTAYLGKTPLVIFGGLFLPMMFMKLLGAARKASPLIWCVYGTLGVAATLISFFFANTKNGIALFVIVFIVFLYKLIGQNSKKYFSRTGIIMILLPCVAVFGLALKHHVSTNSAWQNLLADFKISDDIDKSSNWKDKTSPLPLNEFGLTVNGSTYECVAWGRAGLELLREHPLGYGLIHRSFGAPAVQKWSDSHKPDGKTRGATPSGWLDFSLGFGILGLLLLLVPLLVSFSRARKRLDFWSTYCQWAVPVIAISYLTTEVCTDHFIELLFFMTALFLSLTSQKTSSPSGEFDG